MKGADDRVVQPNRRVDVDALLHLGGGAFGEGDGKDLVRLRRAGGDEMDDARGQDMGLPRPSAGDDQEGSGAVLDSMALLGLQPLKDVRLRLAESEAELLGHRLPPTR